MTDKAARDAMLDDLAHEVRRCAVNWLANRNAPIPYEMASKLAFDRALAALLAAAKETS